MYWNISDLVGSVFTRQKNREIKLKYLNRIYVSNTYVKNSVSPIHIGFFYPNAVVLVWVISTSVNQKKDDSMWNQTFTDGDS